MVEKNVKKITTAIKRFKDKYAHPWLYMGSGELVSLKKDLPSDFGDSDFMESHYYIFESFPGDRNGAALFCVHGVKCDFSEVYPRLVVELMYDEGDFICFESSWKMLEFISSLMPLINYYGNQKEQDE